MASATANDGWVIESVEKEHATFDDEPQPLLSWQIRAVESYRELLQEDQISLTKRSKQRRSERLRVRTLFGDIFIALGPEVFLLCVLAGPISRWNSVTPRDIIPELRRWWKNRPHPHGLSTMATEACESYAIRNLVTSSPKNYLAQFSAEKGVSSASLIQRQSDHNEEDRDDFIVAVLDYLVQFNMHCHIGKPFDAATAALRRPPAHLPKLPAFLDPCFYPKILRPP